MPLPRALSARIAASLLAVAAAIPAAAQAMPTDFGSWSSAVRVEEAGGADPAFNGAGLDGCPYISRDGNTFYMASNRPGGLGGLDIWVSTREREGDPWGAPVNVGAPVNSASNDFCPTISRNGHRFYFVSNRPGGCGGADIYVTQLRNKSGFEEPDNVGCGVNSAADEASPMPIPERGDGPSLYFSSVRPGGYSAEAPGAAIGDSDVYVSRSHGGAFGQAVLVPGVNTASEDGAAEHPPRRARAVLLQQPARHAGPQRHLLGVARERVRAVVDAGQPGAGRQQRPGLGDATVALLGREDPLLRVTCPGGDGNADHYVTTR